MKQSPDIQGYFPFQNLTFGKFTINETLQDGWSHALPQSGFHSEFINITYLEYSNPNFTNQRSMSMSTYKLDQNNGRPSDVKITLQNLTGGRGRGEHRGFERVMGRLRAG